MEENKKGILENRTVKIEKIIDDIKTGNIQIPDIQRGLVWTNEQKTKLLITLLNKYPYGAIILGETFQLPNCKFIIDGLQRTTTMIDIYYNPLRYINDEIERGIIKEFVDNYVSESLSWNNPDISDEGKVNLSKICSGIINKAKNKMVSKIDDENKSKIFDNVHYFNFNRDVVENVFMKTFKKFKDSIFNDMYIQLQEYKGDESDISEIFQVINEQGKPLTDIEILKSKLSKYKIEIDINQKAKIINLKKIIFDNILKEYNFKKINSDNYYFSIFDYFFYIVYDVFNSGKITSEIKKSPILGSFEINLENNKEKNLSMEWFKIVRFILTINHNYEGTLENVIHLFFNKFNNDKNVLEKEIDDIKKLLLLSLEEINNKLCIFKYKCFSSGKKATNKNLKFDSSESFLIIATFSKLIKEGYDFELDNDYKFKNILKHIIKYAYEKPFSSSSYEKAYHFFISNDMVSNITKSDTYNNDADFNDKIAILKVITPLILLNGDKAQYIYYKKLIDDDILNKADITDSKTKDSFTKSISNFFVIISNDDNEKNKSNKELFKDYFYNNCIDESSKERYDELVEIILEDGDLTYQELKEFRDLRINIMFNGR